MKSFWLRSQIKEGINNHPQREFYVNAWEIRYCHLGVNIWYEEDGKGLDYKRPVLVIKKIGWLFFVVPMTTHGKDSQYYYQLSNAYFNKDSWILLSQVRMVDKKRFIELMWVVNQKDFLDIKQKLRVLLWL